MQASEILRFPIDVGDYEILPPTGVGTSKYVSVRERGTHVFLLQVSGETVGKSVEAAKIAIASHVKKPKSR